MQYNTKYYWEQPPQQKNIIVPTRTIIHPCLDVINVTEVKKPKRVCNKNQARKAIQMHTLCLKDSHHDFILEKSNIDTKLNTRENKC